MLKNDGRRMEGSRARAWCGPWNNSSNYFTILPYCNNNNKAWDAEATCFSCCLGPKIFMHPPLFDAGGAPSLSTSSRYIIIAHSFFSQKYRCIRPSTIIPISSDLHMSFPMFYNS